MLIFAFVPGKVISGGMNPAAIVATPMLLTAVAISFVRSFVLTAHLNSMPVITSDRFRTMFDVTYRIDNPAAIARGPLRSKRD